MKQRHVCIAIALAMSLLSDKPSAGHTLDRETRLENANGNSRALQCYRTTHRTSPADPERRATMPRSDQRQACFLGALPGRYILLGSGGLLRSLARALGRIGKNKRPTPRNGGPRGGKANLNRIHTETYGKGSVTGAEREWGELTPAERVFSRELAAQGFKIRLIPRRRDQKTPDFEVTGNGVTLTFELKTLTNFGKRTVESNIRKAYKQNPDVIFINCRNVEANRESVVRQITNAEAKLKTSLQGKVVVWMPDGSTITH